MNENLNAHLLSMNVATENDHAGDDALTTGDGDRVNVDVDEVELVDGDIEAEAPPMDVADDEVSSH